LSSQTEPDDILERLLRIYTEYSPYRRGIGLDSQMCRFWRAPTVEIFVGSAELCALEIEFDIKVTEEQALELHVMSVGEAAEFIRLLISRQNSPGKTTDAFIDAFSAEAAKNILKEIWHGRSDGRLMIVNAIENIKFKNSLQG